MSTLDTAATSNGPFSAALKRIEMAYGELPGFFQAYLAAFLIIIAAITFWVPLADFDSNTSYLARIALDRLGNLRDVATLELQYLFPRSYDYVHAPFLALSYFETLPSLLTLLLALVIFPLALPPHTAALAIAGCFLAEPLLAGVGSGKNDLPLAAFALLSWYVVCYAPRSAYYLSLCGLSLALLLGTKWHGLLIIAPLAPIVIYRLITERFSLASNLILALCASPIIFIVASGPVYLENIFYDGSPFPRPSWLANQTDSIADLPANLWHFIQLSILDTFDPIFFFVDRFAHAAIWNWLVEFTDEAKRQRYLVYPSAEISGFGAFILIALSGSVVALCSKHISWQIKVAATVALFYTLTILTLVVYTSWSARYYIASYVLSLPALCSLIAARWPSRFPITAACAAAIPISLHVLIIHGEHPLVPFTLIEGDQKAAHTKPSIFGRSRDELRFIVWSGYAPFYQMYRKAVRSTDSLTFIDGSQGGDVPFLYPFIKDRRARNTSVISTRLGNNWQLADCYRSDYVLAYRYDLTDARFKLVEGYPGPFRLNLYKRVGPCDAKDS